VNLKISAVVLKMGQFGKRRLKLLGVLMMGFSFFILKFIGNAVCATWRQAKCILSKLLSLTNRSSAVQHGGKTGEELKAEGK
jgi:hypothetical protein